MLRRDTVGVGGIEPVSGKEVVGLALGEQQPVKHQGAACGVPGGEFHIVGHHQNRRALPAQCQQQLRQLRLGIGVQPLGGLVQQQHRGLPQQQLAYGKTLDLAAGQVVGMPRQQWRQLQLFRHLHGLGFVLFGTVQQLLLHRIGHKQRPGVLGQHTQPLTLCQLHLAPIGLPKAGQCLHQCGFACAVAAQQTQQLTLMKRYVCAPQDILALFGIAEPKLLAL